MMKLGASISVREDQHTNDRPDQFRGAPNNIPHTRSLGAAATTSLNESQQDHDLTLGKLPAEDERLKDAIVYKLCQEEWQTRFLVLTADDLVIAHVESDEISDKIPLHEIRLVTKVFQEDDDLAAHSDRAFNVHTVPGGYNCGRDYCFGLETDEDFEDWVETLIKTSKVAAKRFAKRTLVESYRAKVRKITGSSKWQRGIGLLIAANLVVNVAQSQADPLPGSPSAIIFNTLDTIFTAAFAFELVLNIIGYWFRAFITDGWLVFDFCVVTISVISLLLDSLPGITFLRLLRTFRVLRLFNQLQSLRTLINALAASLFPVFNAFLLVILVCVVYAILGVQLFSDLDSEHFGNFVLSYWTMFQISTFDGWTDVATKVSTNNASGIDPLVAGFFCSFIGAVCWILIPVVVAILLDNFVRAVNVEKMKVVKEEEALKMKALGMSKADICNPLDPLLEYLTRFRNPEDLNRRIKTLFRVLDVDRGGTLDFSEIQQGLRKMDRFQPRIHISNDDYHRLTRSGALCEESGEMSPKNFDMMIHEEVATYVYMKVAEAYDKCSIDNSFANTAILAALKMVLDRLGIGKELQGDNTDLLASKDNEAGAPQDMYTLRTELRDARNEIREARLEIRGVMAEVLTTRSEILRGQQVLHHMMSTESQRRNVGYASNRKVGREQRGKQEAPQQNDNKNDEIADHFPQKENIVRVDSTEIPATNHTHLSHEGIIEEQNNNVPCERNHDSDLNEKKSPSPCVAGGPPPTIISHIGNFPFSLPLPTFVERLLAVESTHNAQDTCQASSDAPRSGNVPKVQNEKLETIRTCNSSDRQNIDVVSQAALSQQKECRVSAHSCAVVSADLIVNGESAAPHRMCEAAESQNRSKQQARVFVVHRRRGVTRQLRPSVPMCSIRAPESQIKCRWKHKSHSRPRGHNFSQAATGWWNDGKNSIRYIGTNGCKDDQLDQKGLLAVWSRAYLSWSVSPPQIPELSRKVSSEILSEGTNHSESGNNIKSNTVLRTHETRVPSAGSRDIRSTRGRSPESLGSRPSSSPMPRSRGTSVRGNSVESVRNSSIEDPADRRKVPLIPSPGKKSGGGGGLLGDASGGQEEDRGRRGRKGSQTWVVGLPFTLASALRGEPSTSQEGGNNHRMRSDYLDGGRGMAAHNMGFVARL